MKGNNTLKKYTSYIIEPTPILKEAARGKERPAGGWSKSRVYFLGAEADDANAGYWQVGKQMQPGHAFYKQRDLSSSSKQF